MNPAAHSPDVIRAVLALVAEGRAHQEIADGFGISRSAVAGIVFRNKRKMRKMRRMLTDIIGRIPVKIMQDGGEIRIIFADGASCLFWHEQDCCEGVYIKDVNGDWNDLINTPLLVAEERTNEHQPDPTGGDTETWTFYTFRSVKGTVDVSWYGTSSGHYSEGVDFKLTAAREKGDKE